MQTITRDNLINFDDYEKKSVMSINPGETIQIETVAPYSNPNLTGPISINGVESGDTISFEILDIELGNDAVMFFGHNKNEPRSGVLRNHTPNSIEKKIPIVDNKLERSQNLFLDIEPMVGRIALMKSDLEFNTGDYGGNMDTKELGIGSKLYLHDQTGVGKFLLGDVHAAMGDGEVCGTGIEISAKVTVKVDVIKKVCEHRPIIENDDSVICLATRKSHEAAYERCILDMVNFIQKKHGLSFEEANCFVSAVGDLSVSTVVVDYFTYKMIMNRKYLSDVF